MHYATKLWRKHQAIHMQLKRCAWCMRGSYIASQPQLRFEPIVLCFIAVSATCRPQSFTPIYAGLALQSVPAVGGLQCCNQLNPAHLHIKLSESLPAPCSLHTWMHCMWRAVVKQVYTHLLSVSAPTATFKSNSTQKIVIINLETLHEIHLARYNSWS